jgi:hypothetical protein
LRTKAGPDFTRIAAFDREASGLARADLFYYGLAKTVEALVHSGKRVVILADVPELPFFPRDCIMGRGACRVPMTEVLGRQRAYRDVLARLSRRFPTLRIFDPLGLVCGAAGCSYEKDGVVFYRDSHHLTAEGARRYGRDLVRWLDGAGRAGEGAALSSGAPAEGS